MRQCRRHPWPGPSSCCSPGGSSPGLFGGSHGGRPMVDLMQVIGELVIGELEENMCK